MASKTNSLFNKEIKEAEEFFLPMNILAVLQLVSQDGETMGIPRAKQQRNFTVRRI